MQSIAYIKWPLCFQNTSLWVSWYSMIIFKSAVNVFVIYSFLLIIRCKRLLVCVYSITNQDINVISNLKDLEKWTHFKTGAQSLRIHLVFIVITLIMINSFSTNVPKACSWAEFRFSNFRLIPAMTKKDKITFRVS